MSCGQHTLTTFALTVAIAVYRVLLFHRNGRIYSPMFENLQLALFSWNKV